MITSEWISDMRNVNSWHVSSMSLSFSLNIYTFAAGFPPQLQPFVSAPLVVCQV